ncbi:MAG: response regulator transcription factor [bacterium]
MKILLADDHPLVRSGIASIISGLDGFVIVGEAVDGAEAVSKTKELNPDVVIIDLSMPKLSGIEAAKIIKAKYPSTRILILTMHENEQYISQIIKSGADGYVLKSAGKEELGLALRALAHGEKYFSARVTEIMAESYAKQIENNVRKTSADAVPLTKREKEILKLVVRGCTNQQIADQLYISPRTVDTHRSNIMQKLDIHDVASLVRYAIDHGLSGDEDSPHHKE